MNRSRTISRGVVRRCGQQSGQRAAVVDPTALPAARHVTRLVVARTVTLTSHDAILRLSVRQSIRTRTKQPLRVALRES
jgi:hypothetical protein